jgi:hypothetical protein
MTVQLIPRIKMNDDMPWVIGLSDEEIQELRSKKQELTKYGKEKIRKLMNDGKLRFYDKGKETLTIDDSSWGKVQTPEMKLEVKEMTENYPDYLFEEAARREAINKEALESMGIDYENFGQKPWDESMLEETEKREAIVAKVSEEDYQKVLDEVANKKALEALDNLMEENQEGMSQLAEIEKEEWERQQRTDRILERYNQFYNTEVSGLTWGTHITPEFQQAMALECMLDALRCENLNHEFSEVSTDDINALIEGLYKQGKDYLQRVEEFKDSADGVV